MALRLAEDQFKDKHHSLKKDKRSLKVELKETELSHEDVIRNLRMEYDKENTKLREELERRARVGSPRRHLWRSQKGCGIPDGICCRRCS